MNEPQSELRLKRKAALRSLSRAELLADAAEITDDMARFDAAAKASESHPCILCGAPPKYGSVFAPDNPQKFGAPPNKTRFIFYTLCSPCRERADLLSAVERVIQAQIGWTQ
jgi:hypothetical protein